METMRREIVIASLLAGMVVGAAACSGGASEEASRDGGIRAASDGSEVDAESDATGDVAPRGDASDDVGVDAGEETSDCDGRVCDECVACRYREPAERTCAVEESEPPARCDRSAADFEEWGSASVLTSLELTSSAAQECCFNIDGSKDGSADNQLGELAAALPFDVDREIKERLATEDFATLIEHDGLSGLESPQSFFSNVYVGYFADAEASGYLENVESDCNLAVEDCAVEASSGESFLVSPESFEEGTHPQVQFDPAETDEGDFEAGPSRLVLDFGVRGVGALVLRIHGATIEADVDGPASELDGDGVVLDNGRLGGYVLLEDIVSLLNNLLAPCDCLNNPDRAITYPGTPEGDPDLFPEDCSGSDCELACRERVEERTGDCGADSGVICEEADRICTMVSGLPQLADLNSDDDEQLDALSIGALFETKGARIAGVADYVNMPDQQLGAGVQFERVFVRESGWVAVYGNRSYDQEALLGYRHLEAGNHTEVAVDLDDGSPAEYLPRLHAVLHRDDGEEQGTFEPEADSKVERHAEMSGWVSDGAEFRAE